MKSMYVANQHGSFVLRQECYRAQLAAGKEHSDDLCAIATSLRQMHSMVDHLWPGQIDYSAVEPTPVTEPVAA